MITVRDITKTYTNGKIETRVLRGIDLDIADGDFVAIMGKSGAGKSTLLYQLGLLDVPTTGTVVIDGTEMTTLSDKERTRIRLNDLGYIFQDYALVPDLTATENVMIPLMMQGISRKESRGIAEDVLKRIGLGVRLNNRPSQLSGGEQQRVSIARAVAQKPKILFADEPTANLDTVSGASVLQLLKDLHDEGQTIVMVTHELEYTKFCNRIISLEDGKIIDEQKK